ncbi:MAG: hypothetical protein O2958_06170 [Gemmatimonadetes bacterium]|nr:hypothetical protein [Gemmatimonadota bacterium]
MTDQTSRVEKYRSDLSATVDFLSYLRPSIGDSSWYTSDYFDWKIARNPFGASASYLRLQDDRAAAHCSIVAKPGNERRLEGTVLGELGDTHTHPDFQKRGHFAAIGRHVIDDFTESAPNERALIYGLPNANALPGWTRSIGCRQIDRLRVVEMRWVPWRGLLRWPWHTTKSKSLELRPLADGAAVVDEVWANVQDRGWLLRKDSRWWKWRYSASVDAYRTFAVHASAGGRAVGWVVVRVLPTRLPGVARYAICDIVTNSEQDESVVLELILRTAGPTNLVSGWFGEAHPLAERAVALGFERTRDVPVVFADNKAFHELSTDGRPCRLSMGDTDVV